MTIFVFYFDRLQDSLITVVVHKEFKQGLKQLVLWRVEWTRYDENCYVAYNDLTYSTMEYMKVCLPKKNAYQQVRTTKYSKVFVFNHPIILYPNE